MIKNPYTIGSVINDEESFIGRDKTIKTILDTIPKQHIIIHGQRRIGKTSIIRKIKSEFSKKGSRYLPIEFDLQKIDPDVNYVSKTLARIIQKGLNITDTPIDLGDHPGENFISTWLPKLFTKTKKLGVDGIILLFDEFDSIDSNKQNSSLGEFYNFLKRLIKHKKIHTLTVLGREPGELSGNAKKLLARHKQIHIALMTKDEIDAIVDLSAGQLNWTKEARKKVWDLAKGHPLIAQSLCYKVFEEKIFEIEQNHKPKIFIEDIDDAYPIREHGNIIQYAWNGLSPEEKVVICRIAASGPETTTQDVMGFIEDRGLIDFYKKSPLPYLFKELGSQEWLDQKDDRVKIRISIYGQWVQLNFDIEVLIHDLFDTQAKAFELLLQAKAHDNLREKLASLENSLKLDPENREVEHELTRTLEAVIEAFFDNDNYSLANKYAVQLARHNPSLGRHYIEKAKEGMSERVLLQRIELYLQNHNFPEARKLSKKLEEIKSAEADVQKKNVNLLQLQFVTVSLFTNLVLGIPFVIAISGLRSAASFLTNSVTSGYLFIFSFSFLGAALLRSSREALLGKIAASIPYLIGFLLVYFGIITTPEFDAIKVSVLVILLLVNAWIVFGSTTDAVTKGFFVSGICVFIGILLITGGIQQQTIESGSLTTLWDKIKNPPDNSDYIWKIMNDVVRFISTR